MILPMEGDAGSGLKPGSPTVFLNSKAEESNAMFSPDGQWLAYASSELGSTDLFVRPFPKKAGGARRVTTEGGFWPFWSATSHDLLFVNRANRLMFAAYAVEGDAFTPSQPKPWSPAGFQPTPTGGTPYALHPDGKRVVVAAGAAPDAAEVRDKVVFYFGFGEYLKKIAPVKR